MSWEYLVQQRPALRRQLAENDPLIFCARSPPDQTTLFKLFDHVCGARAGHEDPIPNLTERQGALVMSRHAGCGMVGQQSGHPALLPFTPMRRVVTHHVVPVLPSTGKQPEPQ